MASTGTIFNKLFGLEGQVAVVNGGTGRIGSAVSAGLAAAGAKVCILDLAYDQASELAARLTKESGNEVIAVKADSTSRAELEAAAAEITRRLAAPTILVNSTQFRGQGFYSSDVSAYPLEAWNNVIDVNLTGVFLACQVFGRAMAAVGGGSIVNLASTYGVVSADPASMATRASTRPSPMRRRKRRSSISAATWPSTGGKRRSASTAWSPAAFMIGRMKDSCRRIVNERPWEEWPRPTTTSAPCCSWSAPVPPT